MRPKGSKNKIFNPNNIYDKGKYSYLTVKYKGKDFQYKIDKDDKEEIIDKKWHRNYGGYAYTCSIKPRTMLHRLIMKAMLEKGKVVDHINGDRLDNTLKNLRVVTQRENVINTSRYSYSKNKRGNLPKGVSMISEKRLKESPNTKKYRAYITKDYKHIWMKSFSTLKEALKARKEKELEVYGKIYN